MSENISSYFDNIAKDRNTIIANNPIVEYEQQERHNAMLSYLDPKAGEMILDIGCGNARDIITIIKKGSKVTGIDIDRVTSIL